MKRESNEKNLVAGLEPLTVSIIIQKNKNSSEKNI